jgi:hypothetical protein
MGGLFEYRHHNSFYVQGKDGGIKYTYNNGHPVTDNPKLAARHFINALDRVTKIAEHYKAELAEHNTNIPVLEKVIAKPFEKENELKSLKSELSKLEREISIKIKERQLLSEKAEENISVQQKFPEIKINQKQVPVVTMETEHKMKRRGIKL